VTVRSHAQESSTAALSHSLPRRLRMRTRTITNDRDDQHQQNEFIHSYGHRPRGGYTAGSPRGAGCGCA
jgi:hypothetical protein